MQSSNHFKNYPQLLNDKVSFKSQRQQANKTHHTTSIHTKLILQKDITFTWFFATLLLYRNSGFFDTYMCWCTHRAGKRKPRIFLHLLPKRKSHTSESMSWLQLVNSSRHHNEKRKTKFWGRGMLLKWPTLLIKKKCWWTVVEKRRREGKNGQGSFLSYRRGHQGL